MVNVQDICDSRFRCHNANVHAKDAIILASLAYPLSKYLIAPYRDNGYLPRKKKQFNYYLSSTKVFKEQAFEIRKFKILNHTDI